MVMNGNKETVASVARAKTEFENAYNRLIKVWGTVTVTETYDASFVSAQNHMKALYRKYLVQAEALGCGN